MGGHLKKSAQQFAYMMGYHLYSIYPDLNGIKDSLRVVANKNVIFCLNAGRSGSDTLHRLFQCIKDLSSFHEPFPGFHQLIRRVQKHHGLASYFVLCKKYPFIASIDNPAYAETSHAVCKGFFEPIIASGTRPSFIILKRDPRSIAKSMLRLNTIPGRTRSGNEFYIYPDDPVFLKLEHWQDLTDYQLCYWYALEVHQRLYIYRQILREHGLKLHDLHTHDLNNKGLIMNMFNHFGMTTNMVNEDKLTAMIGESFNDRSEVSNNIRSINFSAEESVVEKNIKLIINADNVADNIMRLRNEMPIKL